MTRVLLALAMIIVTSSSPLIQAGVAATLCQQDEQVFFHCSVQGGRKMVSLCGSSQLTATEGYLQYRFGSAKNVELEFPRQRAESQKQFQYAHYLRYQVDRTEVSFKRAGYTYTLFDSYEGDIQPPRRRRGIQIDASDTKKKSAILQCRGTGTSKLQTLDTVVPCDKENPLNLGSCP
jgi:hypothetical protein